MMVPDETPTNVRKEALLDIESGNVDACERIQHKSQHTKRKVIRLLDELEEDLR